MHQYSISFVETMYYSNDSNVAAYMNFVSLLNKINTYTTFDT